MPRYYFDLYNDRNTVDQEGEVFPDLATALDHARTAVRKLGAEAVSTRGQLVLDHRLVVRSEETDEQHIIHFGDVIRIVPHDDA